MPAKVAMSAEEKIRLVQLAKTPSRRGRKPALYEHYGRRLPLRDWAVELGVTSDVLLCRLKRGWSVERTLTEEVRAKKVCSPEDAKRAREERLRKMVDEVDEEICRLLERRRQILEKI